MIIFLISVGFNKYHQTLSSTKLLIKFRLARPGTAHLNEATPGTAAAAALLWARITLCVRRAVHMPWERKRVGARGGRRGARSRLGMREEKGCAPDSSDRNADLKKGRVGEGLLSYAEVSGIGRDDWEWPGFSDWYSDLSRLILWNYYWDGLQFYISSCKIFLLILASARSCWIAKYRFYFVLKKRWILLVIK